MKQTLGKMKPVEFHKHLSPLKSTQKLKGKEGPTENGYMTKMDPAQRLVPYYGSIPHAFLSDFLKIVAAETHSATDNVFCFHYRGFLKSWKYFAGEPCNGVGSWAK